MNTNFDARILKFWSNTNSCATLKEVLRVENSCGRLKTLRTAAIELDITANTKELLFQYTVRNPVFYASRFCCEKLFRILFGVGQKVF